MRAEEMARQCLAVDVRHVGAQHERGLVLAWQRLQMSRLADGELDGIRRAARRWFARRADMSSMPARKLDSLKKP